MARRKPKLEKGSLWILVLLGVAPLVIAGLQKLGVVDLSSQMASLLVLIGAGFVGNEQMRKHGKKLFRQTSTILLSIFIGLAVVSALFSLMGSTISQLAPFEGVILLGIALGAIIELRN